MSLPLLIAGVLSSQVLTLHNLTVNNHKLTFQMREEDLRSLMFGDYMNPDAEPEDRRYDEVKSLDDMYKVTESCLEEYNNTHKTRMNLVIFR